MDQLHYNQRSFFHQPIKRGFESDFVTFGMFQDQDALLLLTIRERSREIYRELVFYPAAISDRIIRGFSILTSSTQLIKSDFTPYFTLR